MLRFRDPQPGSAELLYVRAVLENDGLVMLPTDTVYGLAALAMSEAACVDLYTAKGRSTEQPTAVLFSSLADVRATLPAISSRALAACDALLPGPFTLLVHDSERLFPWLGGRHPDVVGIRVPVNAEPLPAIAATSANLPGMPEVERVEDLPREIMQYIVCAVDRGPRPAGGASTVLDLVDWEAGSGDPGIVRDPAGHAADALQRLAYLL